MAAPNSPTKETQCPQTLMTDEEKVLLENIRKIMNEAADLTQKRASTEQKYRTFLTAEAILKKQLAREKTEKAAQADFLATMAKYESHGEGVLANREGGDMKKEEDKTALMDDDWLVIDGIVDWEALARD